MKEGCKLSLTKDGNVSAIRGHGHETRHLYDVRNARNEYLDENRMLHLTDTNVNGWPVYEVSWEGDGDGNRDTETFFTQLDDVGIARRHGTNYKAETRDSSWMQMETATGVDQLEVTAIRGEFLHHGKGGGMREMLYLHNANMGPSGTWGIAAGGSSNEFKPAYRYFETTPDNRVLTNLELQRGVRNIPLPSGYYFGISQPYIYGSKNQPLAMYSYPETILKVPDQVNVSNVLSAGLGLMSGMGASLAFATKSDIGNGTFKNANEIEAVSGSYPPSAPPVHVVKQAGETCTTLARTYFHDESLAGLIAAYNRIPADKPLGMMEQIHLPNLVLSAKRSDTAMNYNKFAECLRQQLPFLPLPEIEQDDNFIKQLVPILAVAISCIVAPYLAGAVLGVTTSAAAASAASLVGGAATGVGAVATATAAEAAIAGLVNASLQGVAIMGGLQDKFSYGQLFSAMGGAVMKGVGTGGATSGLGVAAVEVTKVAAFNIGHQLTRLAAGEINRFDVTSVAKDIGITLATLGVNKVALGESISPVHDDVPGGFLQQQGHNYLHQATGIVTDAAVEVIQTGHLNMHRLVQNAIGSAINRHVSEGVELGANKATRYYKDKASVQEVKPMPSVHRKQPEASSSRGSRDTWVDLSSVMGDSRYHAGEPSLNGMFGRGHGGLDVAGLQVGGRPRGAVPHLDLDKIPSQLSELNRQRLGQARQASPFAKWSSDTAGLSALDKGIYGAYLGYSAYLGTKNSFISEGLKGFYEVGSSIVNGVTHPAETMRHWHEERTMLYQAGVAFTLDSFLIAGGLDQGDVAHHNMATRRDYVLEAAGKHVSANWAKVTSGQPELMGQGLYHFAMDAASLWGGRGIATSAGELAYRAAREVVVASRPVVEYGLDVARQGAHMAKYGALYSVVESVERYPHRSGMSFFNRPAKSDFKLGLRDFDTKDFFPSGGDRLFKTLGPARVSHPEEYLTIIAELREN